MTEKLYFFESENGVYKVCTPKREVIAVCKDAGDAEDVTDALNAYEADKDTVVLVDLFKLGATK
ncbi:hypothetical protein [Telmatospirillum sp.]|uniref:hypothetical protein n=1 Tax=Telmatospirillum sp. TaxID=2079197 RepID=UPI00284E80C2|nr:hypothetical protein [Telmatospirillum sp.]MDR3436462.1 hypothetical protein [Telmatospirillum sp.]